LHYRRYLPFDCRNLFVKDALSAAEHYERFSDVLRFQAGSPGIPPFITVSAKAFRARRSSARFSSLRSLA
jgi:hypothetical protein